MAGFKKGKYVDIDALNSEALGICDYSGFRFKRKDLVKQMVWAGNRLVWNGFLVGKPFVDKPNDQMRPPSLRPDPVPVLNPRPTQGTDITWSTIQSPVWSALTVFSWSSWGDFEDGTPALPEEERAAALQDVYWGA